MKDVFETKIDRIKRGRIREPIKRSTELSFLICKERQDLVHQTFVQHSARSPDEKMGIFNTFDAGRQRHGDHSRLQGKTSWPKPPRAAAIPGRSSQPEIMRQSVSKKTRFTYGTLVPSQFARRFIPNATRSLPRN
jgi:hypothetical protein